MKHVRIHFIPPITGHNDCPAAPCIALAARIPGDERQVVDPAHRPRVLVDQATESESNRAVNISGMRTSVRAELRQKRRHRRACAFRDPEHGHRRGQRVEG